MNKTDDRIAKLFRNGIIDLKQIAKKIGRPGDTKRVKEALLRKHLVRKDYVEYLDGILDPRD